MPPSPTTDTPPPPPPRHPNRHVLPSSLFSLTDPDRTRELLLLIVEFLNDRGLSVSATVLRDEAQLSTASVQAQHTSKDRAKLRDTAAIEGDWETLREMAKKIATARRKAFLYAILKQEYLELINAQESQLAFAFFNRCLKPLESFIKQVAGDEEFTQLLYLTTCKSVRDVTRFHDWNLIESRVKLVRTLSEMTQDEVTSSLSSTADVEETVPPNRLLTLIQQAYAYQIMMSHAHPLIPSRVDSLLRDYSYMLVPNSPATPHVYTGHTTGVKCLTWLGTEYLASGSADGTLGIWHVGESEAKLLQKQRSKIWDVACSRDTKLLGCVHADSFVTLHGVSPSSSSEGEEEGSGYETHLVNEIDTKHRGDVYSIKFLDDSFVTTGFDHTAKQFDIETGQCIKIFTGHTAAVTSVETFGNLVVTGSKDRTVMFFDLSSGVCVRTLDRIVGEVTSIKVSSNAERLLVASKDSTHRIFDLRTSTCLTRLKGAVNSSKSFLRAGFGSNDNVVMSGSEAGTVLVWDATSGALLQTLKGHRGTVYRSVWNETLGMMATCSDDGLVRCWTCNHDNTAA